MASVYKYLKVENVAGLRKLIISNSAKKNALDIEAYIEITGGFALDVIVLKLIILILNRFVFQMHYGWLLSMIQCLLLH